VVFQDQFISLYQKWGNYFSLRGRFEVFRRNPVTAGRGTSRTILCD